jgi:glycerate-2-kinase
MSIIEEVKHSVAMQEVGLQGERVSIYLKKELGYTDENAKWMMSHVPSPVVIDNLEQCKKVYEELTALGVQATIY